MNRKGFLRRMLVGVGAIIAAPYLPKLSPSVNMAQARAIGGFCIVSRQALRNIAFLQSWLPSHLYEQLEEDSLLLTHDHE